MNSETVTIPKDEYIDLLRYKAGAAEARPVAETAPFVRIAPFHSWTSQEERAEILRLHGMGYRVGEIVKIVERCRSTVRRCILLQGTV